MAGRRVVITGVASHWGAELARRLERDPSIEYLAGIDTGPPPVELERTELIEADIRSPLLSRLDVAGLGGYSETSARRHPRLVCCMLRYQPEIGPDLDLPLVRYLTLPVVPTQLGFDPRLQLLHADDATGALRAASANPVRGAVNVAPSGSISLSHILRIARRLSFPIPHPLIRPARERRVRRRSARPGSREAVMAGP